MNPHQRNKIDINKMSEEEQKIFRLYGKVPNTKDLLQNKFKERKYFDSGDYALSKAGKASDAGVTTIGSQHPQPENIPHLNTNTGHNPSAGGNGAVDTAKGGTAGSPVKESSFLHRETSADENASGAPGAGGFPAMQRRVSPRGDGNIPMRFQASTS